MVPSKDNSFALISKAMFFMHSTHRQVGIWMLILCSYMSVTALYSISVNSKIGCYWHSFKAFKGIHPSLYFLINTILALIVFWQGFSGISIWYLKLVKSINRRHTFIQNNASKNRVLWLHCIIGTPVAFWVMLLAITGGLNVVFELLSIDWLYTRSKIFHSLFMIQPFSIRTVYVVLTILTIEIVSILGLWGMRPRFRRRS